MPKATNSTDSAIALTDPAFEFAVLARAIQINGGNRGEPTYKGLAEFIGISPQETNFFEILGLIGTRSVTMIEFIHSMEDEFLDDDMRASLIAGVKNISNIISPTSLMQPFNQVVAGFLNEHDIRLIRSFSQTARRHRPLRVFNDSDREKLTAAIDESLTELRANSTIPRWAITSLEESIRRMKLILRYFKFFGHDAAFDQLIRIQGEAIASSNLLQKLGQLSQHNLVKTAGMISLGVSLLLMPMNIEKGYLFYRSHIHEIVQAVPPLLGGPVARLTHQPHTANGATADGASAAPPQQPEIEDEGHSTEPQHPSPPETAQ